MDYPYIWPATPGYGDSVVFAVAIHQDYLENISGHAR